MKRRLFAKSIPSNMKDGCKVVLINCPTFAVYNCDGVLVSYVCDIPRNINVSNYQKGLISKAMHHINDAIDTFNEIAYCECGENVTPIPDYIKKAFNNDERAV
jgi:hypothetical protein